MYNTKLYDLTTNTNKDNVHPLGSSLHYNYHTGQLLHIVEVISMYICTDLVNIRFLTIWESTFLEENLNYTNKEWAINYCF